MNAKWSLRGVFIAATAGVVVIFAAVAAGRVAARAIGPEEDQPKMSLAASGMAAAGRMDGEQIQGTVGSEERELYGTITALDNRSITVDGIKIFMDAMIEGKASLKLGETVKVHAILQPDGSFLAREVEKFELAGSGMDHHSNPAGAGGDMGHHPEPEQEQHHSPVPDDSGHHAEPGGHHSGHYE